jgi:chemotaxis protein MotB
MPPKTIIVIKKKAANAGQHGGAWKVAYADFVTAMMSLFIVLWLMNTSDHVRKAVAGYFNDPLGRSTLTGTDQSGSDDNLPVTTKNIDQLKKRLEEAIRQVPDLKAFSNQIEITVTPEGLRIELLESKNGTFFDTGNTEPNQHGRELLTVLAHELGGVPNHLSIEGHTDSLPYADDASYGNWELSADRANSARRLMQQVGLRHDQVSQVRGYADQRLRLPNNPLDPSNRRISVIVQYQRVAPPAPVKTVEVPASGGKVQAPPAIQKENVAAAASKPPAVQAAQSQGLAARLLAKLHR